MRSELRAVRTGAVPTVVDLTDECTEFVRREGDGLLHVFVPHATAGIAILETGSGSDEDLLAQLDVLLPRDDRWRHRHGSPGHGRDHVLPAFVPPHAGVPVLEGALAWLGCDLTELVDAGDHVIGIGAGLLAEAGEGEPLVWYRGGYGGFEPR